MVEAGALILSKDIRAGLRFHQAPPHPLGPERRDRTRKWHRDCIFNLLRVVRVIRAAAAKFGLEAMKRCPACGRSRWVTEVVPRNVVERFLLRPLLLRPFLCNHCQVRFQRFSVKSQAGLGPQGRPAAETFLKSRQAMDFEELVDELREAERRLGGGDPEVGGSVGPRKFSQSIR